MGPVSSEQLLVLAKTQLGYSPSDADSIIPPAYLNELKLHLSLYPDDTNFRVTLEPGRGLGKVICLEQGCDKVSIPLLQRVKVRDGGISDGFGSLSAYHRHITEHPTHSKSCLIRTEKSIGKNRVFGTTTSSSTSAKRKNLGLANHLNSLARISKLSQASKATTSSQPSRRKGSVKQEPVELGIPQPRQLSAALGAGACEDNDESQSFSLPKNIKAEVLFKTKKPFALINHNTDSDNIETSAPRPSAFSIKRTQAKINELTRQISRTEATLERLAPEQRSKADLTRRKLASLYKAKDEHNMSLEHYVKPEIKNLLISPAVNNNTYAHRPRAQGISPVASGSNSRLSPVLGVDNMNMNVDDSPESLSAAVLQRIGNVIPTLPGNHDDFYDYRDVNGDFYGRGRDLFTGPQARADDIDKFLIEAGNAEQFDGNASVDRALEKLGLPSQYSRIPGMDVALMPHQTIGVAWMLDKERSALKGGCLGDDMGLGKTVQMIALIMRNRSNDPICKTNLIIAPTALLDQWKLEIEMKTDCDVKTLVYHGPSKPRKKEELLKYDIVLTTYSTMALEWPDFETEQKKKEKAKRKRPNDFVVSDSDSDGNDFRLKRRGKGLGLLFHVDFFRIILDEAQSIRNRRTRASRAVTDLKAEYRWCLTGTPIINSLVDVYGYLRFLKIRPWYDFTEFQGHIGVLEKKNPSLAVARLQAVITTFLLRRMKDSMLDGKRLIELPSKTVSLHKLEFSEEERDIYKMVEARTQANFNRFLRAGTVLKNYSQVLVLLLRLRQICSHPSLIQEEGTAFIDKTSGSNSQETRDELTRARRLVSPGFVSKMKDKFKMLALQRMAAEKESVDAVIEDEECPICFDVLTDAVITPCTHVFCRDCLVDVLNTPAKTGSEESTKFKANERPCPTCRSPVCSEKLFARAAFLPSDEDLLPDAEKPSIDVDVEMTDVTNLEEGTVRTRGSKRKRSMSRIVLDSDDDVDSGSEYADDDEVTGPIIHDDEDEDGNLFHRKIKENFRKKRAVVIVDSDDENEDSPEDREVLFGARKGPTSNGSIKLTSPFLPSTKMKYMMEHLCKLADERPDEKTLIVSQWTGCLQLVSNYLTEAGIVHVKYQGDMNRSKRDQAVRVFMSKDKARVMLMSLKCGGVGLNLTRANNVISLDLGWSQAIEAQSFDRVHRLGQTRPVFVQRLVIADTVEDRVLAMQERKQALSDGSLGEGNGKKIGRLSVKELANLFGLDHRGRLLSTR